MLALPAAPKRTESEVWKWLDIRITETGAQSGKFKTLWTDRVAVCSVVVKQEKGTGTEGSCCAGEVLGRLLTPDGCSGCLNAFTMSFSGSGSGFLVFLL